MTEGLAELSTKVCFAGRGFIIGVLSWDVPPYT